MLLDIVIDVIKYGIISLVLLSLLAWIIILTVRKGRSFKVNVIDGKYFPMMGKKYLSMNSKSGMIECCKNPAESIKYDTYSEARVISEAFLNQRKKRRSVVRRYHANNQ